MKLILLLLLMGIPAQAGFHIGPFFDMGSSTSDDGTTKVASSGVSMDLALGYSFDGGLYVGALYDMINIHTVTETTSSSTRDDRFTAMGPGVGYRSGGFFVMVHSLLEPRLESESGSTTIYKGGTGSQLDLGYVFNVNGSFNVGLDYRYLTYNYKRREVAGAASDVDIKGTSGDFLVAMWFDL